MSIIFLGANKWTKKNTEESVNTSTEQESIESKRKSLAVTKVRNVISEFQELDVQTQSIEVYGETRLINHPDTWFCYFRDSCVSIFRNLSKMRDIVNTGNCRVKAEIINIINSNEFEIVIMKVIRNLDPICKFINKSQDP